MDFGGLPPNSFHQEFTVNPTILNLSKSKLAHLRESPAARERRLARNAERMREKRSNESSEEYRIRLQKNALNNKMKRQGESPTEKAERQVRDAARQRMRRAMETSEQRAMRLYKLAERMRVVRRNESPEKKAERQSKAAVAARERLQRETSEERRVRLLKNSQYARRIRDSKSKGSSISENDSLDGSHDVNLCESQMFYEYPCQALPNPLLKLEEKNINVPSYPQLFHNVHFTVSSSYCNDYSSNSLAVVSEPNNMNFVAQPAFVSPPVSPDTELVNWRKEIKKEA
jgi:hypothetical protein